MDRHIPVPTRPHVSCIGVNVGLDTRRMSPAKCPKYRPSYKCQGPPVFYHYDAGAWQVWHRGTGPALAFPVRGLSLSGRCSGWRAQVNCDRTVDFSPEAFPKDHLRDLFSSFSPTSGDALRSQFAVAPTTITVFITRERWAERARVDVCRQLGEPSDAGRCCVAQI